MVEVDLILLDGDQTISLRLHTTIHLRIRATNTVAMQEQVVHRRIMDFGQELDWVPSVDTCSIIGIVEGKFLKCCCKRLSFNGCLYNIIYVQIQLWKCLSSTRTNSIRKRHWVLFRFIRSARSIALQTQQSTFFVRNYSHKLRIRWDRTSLNVVRLLNSSNIGLSVQFSFSHGYINLPIVFTRYSIKSV